MWYSIIKWRNIDTEEGGCEKIRDTGDADMALKWEDKVKNEEVFKWIYKERQNIQEYKNKEGELERTVDKARLSAEGSNWWNGK